MYSMFIPVVICILGALIYAGVRNEPKLEEVGRIMFFAGLLVTLFLFSVKVGTWLR